MPVERKVYRAYVLKIKLFSNCSTNRALLTAGSHLPKKSGLVDPAHQKRASQWISLIRKERVSGSRSWEKSVSVDPAHEKRAGQWTPLMRKERASGPRSSEKSGSVNPAHQKRAGQWTPLIRKERVSESRSSEKERVSEPRSSEKSGSVEPAHEKRAGQWTPLIRNERVVGKMIPLIGQKERWAVIGLVGIQGARTSPWFGRSWDSAVLEFSHSRDSFMPSIRILGSVIHFNWLVVGMYQAGARPNSRMTKLREQIGSHRVESFPDLVHTY